MTINLNDEFVVHLSEHGQKQWRQYHASLGLSGKYDETVLRLPLWEIMNIFGSMCYMGATSLPFAENSLSTK